MFCYVVANSINCVLKEMLLWSKLSKEHPTFILTVADLISLNLSSDLTIDLTEIHDGFAKVEDEVIKLYEKVEETIWNHYIICNKLVIIFKKILKYNEKFLRQIESLKSYGEENPVWQILIEHIEDEQKYMEILIRTLCSQIY